MENLTNTASTRDWLIASKEMKIRAYIGNNLSSTAQMPKEPETPNNEPILGANLRDAVRITKEWWASLD